MTTGDSPAPAIRVRGVTKSFGELHVLRGVDLDVAPGSIVALLGSNGAGKTTLVRIVSTLLKADSGTVTVGGADVAERPDQVREVISLTGQFAAVDDVLTRRENLVLVARLRHLPDPGAVADAVLAGFALTDVRDRRAAELSGGMRRRLDIAMSLVGEPSVIVVDEQATGLDPQARLDVWRTVRDLASAGTTVLLTTQYLDELRQLLPPAEVRYVEQKPSLEDVFLALVGADEMLSATGADGSGAADGALVERVSRACSSVGRVSRGRTRSPRRPASRGTTLPRRRRAAA